ncbi:DNA-processing protein DprA [Lyngbya confervoides]|uniref:DNA-processing protein DprA n=1 Tax=Lyngbya confervoides BDU141951 TaxID=1574623 RepID=A0ABD4SYJ4_9CYAN|nr:DNA-processing protein DprA [Lyngbya confervoides]MCM1981343.1 DNA-processing protein DprA [Lyngbya confervoides BDU141951]
MDRERAYCLAWAQVPGVGPVLLRRIQQTFGTLESAWVANPTSLQQVSGIGPKVLAAIQVTRGTIDPFAFLAQHQVQNPHFLTWIEPNYPRLLKEISDPPLVLYYRGDPTAAELQGRSPAVAVVGTRDPSDYGKRWTHRLCRTLSRNGFLVVSGMAEGIDTQAHRSCLEANQRTFAVLGTGVDVVYPPRNQGLYEQITQQGCLLSEYPAGTQPNRAHFPRRNRIIAGLCRATLVMEAPSRSGALITAYLANDYARDVYVLPGNLDNPRALGCLGLLSRGAQVILSEGHLLEMLGTIPALDPPHPPPGKPVNLSPQESQLLLTLQQLCQRQESASVSFDLLAQHWSESTGHLSSLLLQLELNGQVKQLPGMRYSLCNP